jgi:hypothetical protein
MAQAAYRRRAYLMSLVLFDCAAKLNQEQTDVARWHVQNEVHRAACLRRLGAIAESRAIVKQSIADIKSRSDIKSFVLGHCYLELAASEWQLGDPMAAREAIVEWQQLSTADPEIAKVASKQIRQSKQIQAILDAGRKAPRVQPISLEDDLKKARAIVKAAEDFVNLLKKESTQNLIDVLLGPTISVEDVLGKLLERSKNDDRPEIYFLPTTEPIGPHLDALLGPATNVDEVLANLTPEYKSDELRKIHTLSINNPVVPHLEGLLGPAKSVDVVLAELSAQYKVEGRSERYVLPAKALVSSHLEELLGPVRSADKVLAELIEQQKAEGRSPIYFLPINRPITPHLDGYIGPIPAEAE